MAAVVAGSDYAPWYVYVERHGGYASRLDHQRGYLDGPSAWAANWLLQLRHLVAFSSMRVAEAALGPSLALIGLCVVGLLERRRLRGPVSALAGLLLVLLILSRASTTWWLGLGLAPFFLRQQSPRVRLLGVWWVALTILTPMYHPYARLWLPLEAAGWLTGGLAIGIAFAWSDRPEGWPDLAWLRSRRSVLIPAGLAALAAWAVPGMVPPRAKPLPGGIGEPRDSLRLAVSRVAANLPAGVRAVRLLGPPPLAFYAAPALARRGAASARVGTSADLLSAADGSWAIVDAVSLRQEGDSKALLDRLRQRWDVAAEVPTTLSNATLLDVDPRAVTGDLSARDEPLYLLRPK